MMHPRSISIQDYTYVLPADRIADHPLPERDASKLLVYHSGQFIEDNYYNLPSHLPVNTLLVFNDTRVVEARLLFTKPTGGTIEIFCLEPHPQYASIDDALQQKDKVLWQCLVGGASKWKPGQVLKKNVQYGGAELTLAASYVERSADSFTLELSWSPAELSFVEVLHALGAVPLPPYIKRNPAEEDKTRYQTIYARHEGSVAAPTAGLHFTKRVFDEFALKKIQAEFVTLHVSAGTFKPVKADIMARHDMHDEWIDISKKAIENILSNLSHPIVAVGTTSLRTIESLYWLGVKQTMIDRNNETHPHELSLRLSQWEAYELEKENIPAHLALQSLLEWMEKNKLERLTGTTQLLIAPGYRFRIIEGLITNFHQPQSTLLLLVAALIGDDWERVYAYALQHDFRFLSYGDGCLLWDRENNQTKTR